MRSSNVNELTEVHRGDWGVGHDEVWGGSGDGSGVAKWGWEVGGGGARQTVLGFLGTPD